MDRRSYIAAFVALFLLIYWNRREIANKRRHLGGYELGDGGDVKATLPTIKLPFFPDFVPGKKQMAQTTGLMCACHATAYSSPIVVRDISMPMAPGPRYIYQTPTPPAQASLPPRTYSVFAMDDSYTLWGGRPSERVWLGSDGRVFLISGSSNSIAFIGRDEYTMQGTTIFYGPYSYLPVGTVGTVNNKVDYTAPKSTWWWDYLQDVKGDYRMIRRASDGTLFREEKKQTYSVNTVRPEEYTLGFFTDDVTYNGKTFTHDTSRDKRRLASPKDTPFTVIPGVTL